MNKISLILAISLFSFSSFSALISFQPQNPIKASDVNANFAHIKQLIEAKDAGIEFSLFSTGQVINNQSMEVEIQKVRDFGLTVTPLPTGIIKASDLNLAFTQMSQSIGNGNFWPTGSQGNLVVEPNTTTTLTAGDIKNYNNVEIKQNGILNIVGASSNEITQIGIKGNLILNGIIRANDGIFKSSSKTITTAKAENITYSIVQSQAGSGSSGTGAGPGAGGSGGDNGIGGGGGGGHYGGAGGSNGGNGGGTACYPGGLGNVTFGDGVGGGPHTVLGMNGGGSGGGATGAEYCGGRAASGGAGGGYKGKHGLGLYLYVKGTISGNGRIELNGTKGFNGGGSPGPGDWGTGGAGGGGAGGSGGKLWLRNTANTLPSNIVINVSGGPAGSGGSGAYGASSGANGASGSIGSIDYQKIP